MVQMESVFLSLKPPVSAIKHLLLIKIPPVLFLDVQGYMLLNHGLVMALTLWKGWPINIHSLDTFCTLLHRYHDLLALIAHHIHHIHFTYRIIFQ